MPVPGHSPGQVALAWRNAGVTLLFAADHMLRADWFVDDIAAGRLLMLGVFGKDADAGRAAACATWGGDWDRAEAELEAESLQGEASGGPAASTRWRPPARRARPNAALARPS